MISASRSSYLRLGQCNQPLSVRLFDCEQHYVKSCQVIFIIKLCSIMNYCFVKNSLKFDVDPYSKWSNSRHLDFRYNTSNVTGRHRGPKQKLQAGVAWAAHFCKFCCLPVHGAPW